MSKIAVFFFFWFWRVFQLGLRDIYIPFTIVFIRVISTLKIKNLAICHTHKARFLLKEFI